jgi:hypothetical protein
MLGHFAIRQEFIVLTKFKMHVDDAIVNRVTRTLQKGHEISLLITTYTPGLELTHSIFSGYGGGLFFPG